MASQFRTNWRSAKLTEKQYGMLEYAELLALEPSSITEVHVEALREVGWHDEDVIDIVHIVGAFSYLVRMADGLGIALEPDWATYKDELAFKEKVAEKPIANELKQAVKAKVTNNP